MSSIHLLTANPYDAYPSGWTSYAHGLVSTWDVEA